MSDIDRYRREKLRRLERENEHLRAYRQRVETVLALALEVAVRGKACGPLDLLAVLEEMTA